MYGAGDVRIETVPDARVIEPTDALVRVPAPASAAAAGSTPAASSIESRISTGCPTGYRLMNEREAIKVLVEF
jgi:hypothetical protein